jgi:hypothetical protein
MEGESADRCELEVSANGPGTDPDSVTIQPDKLADASAAVSKKEDDGPVAQIGNTGSQSLNCLLSDMLVEVALVETLARRSALARFAKCCVLLHCGPVPFG